MSSNAHDLLVAAIAKAAAELQVAHRLATDEGLHVVAAQLRACAVSLGSTISVANLTRSEVVQ